MLFSKASRKSRRYILTKFLANNIDWLEELSTMAKEIRTMLDNLDSKARRQGCRRNKRAQKRNRLEENLFPKQKVKL